MIINLLVAASLNNVIGRDNKLLWELPNDMAYFKNLTWGMPVIMGRKTYDSLGEPLRGRTNIVISRHPAHLPGIEYSTSLEAALVLAARTDAKECYVIGGGQLFKEAIHIADRIYLTRVEAHFEGDTFFPDIDPGLWQLVSAVPFEADEKHAYPYRFEVWERKLPKA